MGWGGSGWPLLTRRQKTPGRETLLLLIGALGHNKWLLINYCTQEAIRSQRRLARASLIAAMYAVGRQATTRHMVTARRG